MNEKEHQLHIGTVMADKLLYDVIQLVDWPVEEEKVLETGNFQFSILKTSYNLLASAPKKALTLAGVRFKPTGATVSRDVLTEIKQQRKWKFAVSPNGKYIAVVQTHQVEVRYMDEELTVTGSYPIAAGIVEGKQVIAWNHESTAFAVALENGDVYLLDTICTLLLTIKLPATFEGNLEDFGKNVCEIIWQPPRGNKDGWRWEMILLTYAGSLFSYFISLTGESVLHHKFNFQNFYPQGITCALMDEGNRLLVIGGNCCGPNGDEKMTADQNGITKWRILSDYPFYKRDLSLDVNAQGFLRTGVMKRFYSYSLDVFQKLYTVSTEGVYNMALSPNQTRLIAIHYNGSISLWNFPSLQLRTKWPLEAQPHYNDVNPSLSSRFGREKLFNKLDFVGSFPFDVTWWNEDSVVIARCSGSLTILSIGQSDLVNVIGEQCEWITPFCQISPIMYEKFYLLECNTETSSRDKKSKSVIHDDEEEEHPTFAQKSLHLTKLWMGLEKEKVKERNFSRKYSLVTFMKTTPQELFERKLDEKEFGEALSIAQAYNLDCDKVFQRQWRSCPVSKASIQDYLSKVKNQLWVFRECLDRVPERIDDAKELFEFALRMTDVDKLAQMANPDLEEDSSDDDDVYEGFDYQAQQQKERETRKKFQDKWMKHVDFDKLSLKQVEMLKCRQKILKYKDRLSTYILLLGGYDAASERYTASDFATFRKRDLFELALEHARSSKWEAVDTLLLYHHAQLNEHRLSLLSNFSETTSPRLYHCLLPEVSDNEVVATVKFQHRSYTDWCEEVQVLTEQPSVDDFYDEYDFLKKFRTDEISPDLAKQWYLERARQIEKLSRQTDGALQLLKLGLEKGVSGLDKLLFDLTTLDNMIFECGCDLSLSLDDVLQKSPLERIRLLMSQSVATTYVRDIQRLVIPFVKGCEDEQLFQTYLIEAAQQELTLPFVVFKHLLTNKFSDLNFADEADVVKTAVECIYAVEDSSQLDLASRILSCLPKCGALKDKVKSLEKHLDACNTLASHKLALTPNEVREISQDRSQVLLLYKRLTRTLARESIISSEQCRHVLEDMLAMASSVFSSKVDKTTCVHVFIESLLTSAVTDNIRLAGAMMVRCEDETNQKKSKGTQLPYKESVDLVLTSAREYFDAASLPLTDNKLLRISRQCLHLITDRPPVIQEQLNLIEAIALLSAFGLEILPLEVRLCKDRLEIVQKVLDMSPTNYTKIEAIRRLATLLNVSGENKNDRNGRTTCAIVNRALQVNDYEVAVRLAKELISMNYEQGWKLCAKLGSCKEISDFHFRHSCISFASSYCDDEDLLNMSEELCKVTALLLEQALEEKLMQMEEEEQRMETTEDPSKVKLNVMPGSRTLRASAELLAGTVNATGALLSGLSLWKGNAQKTVPISMPPDGASVNVVSNQDFEFQSCPTFYKSVMPNAITEAGFSSTGNDAFNSQVTHEQIMLRINALIKADERMVDNLKNLVPALAARDLTLALSYVLAISDGKEAEECFNLLPMSSLSLQLQVYYHCLQVVTGSIQSSVTCLPIYRVSPASFIDYAIKHSVSRESRRSSTPLQLSVCALIDYIQGEKLSGLGQDVDIARCFMDSVYLQDTSHGLAMSTNEEQFLIAILLAEQGSCDVWEILVSHIEYLFTETDEKINQKELFDKLNRFKMLPVLVERGKDFYKSLDSHVFPLIDGRDHATLLCYFALLKECSWNELETMESSNEICQIAPETHIKYLQKISNCASELDYKLLIRKNASDEILGCLKRYLNGSNIAMFCKLLPKMPYQNYAISLSSVMLCWVAKQFWSLPGNEQSNSAWLKRLEMCKKWLVQLDAVDLRSFFEEMLYSERSLETFSYDLRWEFVKLGMKLIKNRKQDQKGSASENDEFRRVRADMEKLSAHLSVFSSPFMKEMIEDAEFDEKKRDFLIRFDRSRSKPELVLPLVMQSLYQSATFVERFLETIPNVDWTVKYVLNCCSNALIEQLSSAKNDAAIKSALSSLGKLLSSIDEYETAEKSHLYEILVSDVQKFCADDNLAVQLKIDVLQLLRKSAALNPNQTQFLLFHRTSELIRSGWDAEMADSTLKGVAEISELSTHRRIVTSLLDSAESLEQVKVISSIADILDQDCFLSDIHQSIWLKILSAFSQHGSEGGGEIIKETKKRKFSETVTFPVFELLLEKSYVLTAVKFALITNIQASAKLQHLLQSVKQIDDTNCDDEMLALLVDSDAVMLTLSTLYYHRAVQYLLSGSYENSDAKVDRLIRQLQDNGNISEAAALLLRYRGSHTVFATFGASISFISDWLNKT